MGAQGLGSSRSSEAQGHWELRGTGSLGALGAGGDYTANASVVTFLVFGHEQLQAVQQLWILHLKLVHYY